ncbi:cytochrome P450 [Amycolatopsis sp. Hca4]|uniref:cytochrome P450 n=1 Tax=Amycolatopsis sp. Hca4 TaxID=2742131 RepID=UPI0015921B14|nr:cytochrome P450 [Amycolatopsis sp. Hca4]QKV74065.1 cytochrome P450 [Amycolatopsis sp. Hca4]
MSRVFALKPDQADNDAILAALLEGKAVQEVALPTGLRVWVVARHAEAKAILLDPRLKKDPATLADPARLFGGGRHPEDSYAVLGRHVLNTDDADHRRLRELLTECLAPKAVHRRRERIAEVVGARLDALARSAVPDLVTGFAQPVLTSVMSEVLGIEEPLLEQLLVAVRTVIGGADPQSAEARKALDTQQQLILAAIDDHDRFPGADTLLKRAFRDYRPRGKLSLAEVMSMIALTVFAGTTTSTTLVAHSAALAVTRDDLLEAITGGPASCSAALTEVLRRYPPTPCATWRFAAEDVELGGVTIPRDATVLVVVAAANRDPLAFPDADRIVVSRTGNPAHLAFGHGPHFCAGAPLALTTANVALPALFARFPRLSLAVPLEKLRWTTNLGDRTLSSVPVRLRPEELPV